MKSNKIEAFRLILILFAFGWQIFENEIENFSSKTDKYQLHYKLDALWEINSALYTHAEFNNSGVIADINYPHIANSWKSWQGIEKEKRSIESQGKFFSILRMLMFCIGSALIIIAKFKEK